MRIPRHLLLAFAALACGACATTTTPTGDPFLGYWTCDHTRTLMFATPANTPDNSSKVRAILAVTSDNGKLWMLAQNAEAGVSCKLEYAEMDKSAVLASGQSCMDTDGIMLTYKTGRADINSTGFQASLEFDFAGALVGDAGTTPDASGTGTIASVCWKQYTGGGGVGVGGGGW